MKFLKIFLLWLIVISLISCSSDDDICLGGEATPRMKVKFKTKESGKLKTLDSLYINVDYGNGQIPVIATKSKIDSVFIPLRIDENPYTEIYVGLSKAAITSKIKINYKTNSKYVSPACGIKKIYENISSEVEITNPVLDIEQNQTQITDESKTHLFLLF
jgi:hypothetical protein